MSNNNTRFTKVYEIGNQMDLQNGELAADWTAGTDVSNLAVTTNNKTGRYAMEFDKDGTTGTTGIISCTLNSKNASLFAIHKLKAYVYISATTNVSSLSLTIGTSASHNNVYTETSLSAGWNELEFECDSPTSTTGNGVNWYDLDYLAFTITFGAAANTLVDIALDTVYLYRTNSAGFPAGEVTITNAAGTKNAIHAEDAAHTSGDVGIMPLGVRNDTLAALAGTDGDYAPLQVDGNGALYVQLGDAAGNSPIATDDSAQDATPEIMNVGGEYRASDTTYTDGDATILQSDINGYLKTASKAYDSVSDSEKVTVQNPEHSQHEEETLADVTNETDATNTHFLDMDGYKHFAVQINTGGTAPTSTVTVTVEATVQDDGTAAASCFYTDVTSTWFGVASVVDTDIFWEKDTATSVKYVKIKTVTAGGGNDQDYVIYAKRMA